jgi:uncharacterized membrane protein YsdA (DUF1294 family)
MNDPALVRALAFWITAWSAWTFVVFGFDKWQAGRGGGRVSEAALFWLSALGGWPGGLLGMIIFRHKSAKGSFQLKFAAAFFAWAALLAGALRLAGKF